MRTWIAALVLAAAPVAAQSDDRVKTVVVPFDVVDADLAVVEALTQIVQGAFARDAFRDVLGPDDIRRVLDLEADRQTVGCTEGGCLEEIASALDAQRLVLGRVIQIEDELLVVVTEVDPASLTALARGEDVVSTDPDAMVEGVRRLALKVAERSRATATDRPTGTLVVETTPPGAQVRISGRSIGLSPVTVDDINEGLHEVSIAPRGLEPFDVKITVVRDSRARLKVDLARSAPIDTEAADALVTDELWGHAFTTGKLTAASLLFLVGSVGMFGTALGGTLLFLEPAPEWVTISFMFGVPTAALLLGGLAMGGWALWDIATLPATLPVKAAAHDVVIAQDGQVLRELSIPVGRAEGEDAAAEGAP